MNPIGLNLRSCLALSIFFCFSIQIHAEKTGIPDLTAASFILADASSGTILLERNVDMSMPPASLAKLMTLHLSMLDVEAGTLSAAESLPVPENGTALSMRPGSSIIGLRKGDRVRTRFLQIAAGAVSANDAAWSLAILSSGNAPEFVKRMNREALRLGMTRTQYSDPDGWSSLSFTTAADQLVLARHYIRMHPDALRNIHSRKTVSYRSSGNPDIVFEKINSNLLVGSYPGADGLKTGTIAPNDFHFIATAKRNDTRLIAIVMGISSFDYAAGLRLRAAEARELLDYGFANWTSFRPPPAGQREIPVRHGKKLSASVVPAAPTPSFIIKLDEIDQLSVVVNLAQAVQAPLDAGTAVGEIRWYAGTRLLGTTEYQLVERLERRWRLRHAFQ